MGLHKNNNGLEISLTAEEEKIIKGLKRLSRLWEKHGDRLLLFNGNSLRVISDGKYDYGNEIEHFSIKGCGGDSGDFFD